jgi:hypothetical protein
MQDTRKLYQSGPKNTLQEGVLYKLENGDFVEIPIPFNWTSKTQEIDNDFYYCMVPPGLPVGLYKYDDTIVAPTAVAPTTFKPFEISEAAATALKLSYLTRDTRGAGYRFWAGIPKGDSSGKFPGEDDPRNIDTLQAAAASLDLYEKIQTQAISALDFLDFTEGLDDFAAAVQTNLVEGNRDAWRTMPALP